jgi:hypothetical protein
MHCIPTFVNDQISIMASFVLVDFGILLYDNSYLIIIYRMFCGPEYFFV